ncbi:MAG: four helix bundle protein [Saprospiraceae bacterium]
MDFKKLLAFRKGFNLAMEIFEITKTFVKEEKYSLTDQIRRSSPSTCGQIAEAYRKRRYVKHYISKLSDGDGEDSETQVWLAFAYTCKYIDQPTFQRLTQLSEEVGKLIGFMMKNPYQFGVQKPE